MNRNEDNIVDFDTLKTAFLSEVSRRKNLEALILQLVEKLENSTNTPVKTKKYGFNFNLITDDFFWTRSEATIKGNKQIRFAAYALDYMVKHILADLEDPGMCDEPGIRTLDGWEVNDISLLIDVLESLGVRRENFNEP